MLLKSSICWIVSLIFFCSEPIGSSVPKFASADRSHTFNYGQLQSISLLCQAQGFPLPAFRYLIKSQFSDTTIFRLPIEPIGSAGPKFNIKDKFNVFNTEIGAMFALLCPAQGLPLPAFRWGGRSNEILIRKIPNLIRTNRKCST